MNMVNKLGPLMLIGTMTTNPNWPEIWNQLGSNETAYDRIDLVCRVFKIKLKNFIYDIFKKHSLGFAIGKIYVIEFQKRGFPHAHILVTLDFNDRPKTAGEFDTFISCQIPDKKEEPILYERVTQHHLHTCGKWCQNENGECRYR